VRHVINIWVYLSFVLAIYGFPNYFARHVSVLNAWTWSNIWFFGSLEERSICGI